MGIQNATIKKSIFLLITETRVSTYTLEYFFAKCHIKTS